MQNPTGANAMSNAEPLETPKPRGMNRVLKRLLIAVAVIVGIGIGLVLLAAPGIRASREATRRVLCGNELRIIGIALDGYQSAYGVFPPAYVADESGKPMHSWRVLILPFFQDPELDALYESYRFEEPWDSEHNRKLGERMPEYFACPSDLPTTDNTNYLAVIGEETMWNGATAASRFNSRDDPSRTILLVESADANVHWLEPRDLTFEQAARGINIGGATPGISSHHNGVVEVLFVAGNVGTLPNNLSSDGLRALLTRAGGEEFDEKELDQ
jgi:hypothetical protein